MGKDLSSKDRSRQDLVLTFLEGVTFPDKREMFLERRRVRKFIRGSVIECKGFLKNVKQLY